MLRYAIAIAGIFVLVTGIYQYATPSAGRDDSRPGPSIAVMAAPEQAAATSDVPQGRGPNAAPSDARIVKPGSNSVDSPSPVESAALVDQWVGVWNGSDGRSLQLSSDITNGPGYYHVAFQDPSSPVEQSARGRAAGTALIVEMQDYTLTFTRGAGASGADRQLQASRDCLVATSGEAYCRS